MSEQDTQKQIESLQHEISELRKRLSDINQEKETLFGTRHEIGKQISTLIKDVKGIRTQRDSLTGTVRLSKDEREKLNDEIRTKIEEVKKLKAIAPQPKEHDDPRRLRREIERLDYKIETEVMSFDKEKQIMKTIKELKKRLDDSEKSSTDFRKIRDLSKDIDRLRSIADSAHEKVQEAAKESQHRHENLVETSNKIDDLKAQEEDINKKITEKKDLMSTIANELDAKNAHLREIKQKAGMVVEEEKKVTAEKRKKKLSELQAEVTDKLMRGEKLTTDDLLIMQSGD